MTSKNQILCTLVQVLKPQKALLKQTILSSFKGQPKLQPQVYEVLVEIPARKIFDVRKAVHNESYRDIAIQMLSENPFAYFSSHHFKSMDSVMELLEFGMYDFTFNENERSSYS